MVLTTTFCYVAGMVSIFTEYCRVKPFIDITDYNYPLPNNNDSIYRIAIFGTNDIHGSAFSIDINHPLKNFTYEYGGLEHMASYIKILRKDWGNRLLWLDGGDQFQGGVESKISNGTIITDFFNEMKINGSTIGNHEWDFGKPFLYERLESASWNYIAANIKSKESNSTEFLPNTKPIKMFKVGEVNIGVIGLTTDQTPFTTSGDLSGIEFLEYKRIIIDSSKFLRENGANAVILTTHIGMKCNNDQIEKMDLKIWSSNSTQKECEKDDEMSILLNSLDEGVIDAVVAGHMHDNAHHWVKGVPVIQNLNGGLYSNVFYLSFDAETKKFIRENTQIEGPLPTCHKVFENTRKCNYLSKSEAKIAGELKHYAFHNIIMEPDKSIEILFEKWWKKVEAYKIKLGFTEDLLRTDYTKENVLGNLAADAIKNKTNCDISIINAGSLRSEWFPGNILVEHVWNMFPFENNIVSFKMTGYEVKKMLKIIQSGEKGLYHTSGISQNFTIYSNHSKPILNSLEMYNGSEIDENRAYIIGTNNFLMGGGDDFKDVISWYNPIEVINYGLVRDHMIIYVKSIGYIRERDLIDPHHPRISISYETSVSKKKNLKNL